MPLPTGRPTMLPRRILPDIAEDRARVDDLVSTLRREATQAETDPFDEALIAAVDGIADAMRAEGEQLTALRDRMRRTARRMA